MNINTDFRKQFGTESLQLKDSGKLSPRAMTSPLVVFYWVYNTRLEIPPMEQALNSIRELLVAPITIGYAITVTPPFHQWAHLVCLAGRCCSLQSSQLNCTTDALSPSGPAEPLLELGKLTSRKVPSSVRDWLLHLAMKVYGIFFSIVF